MRAIGYDADFATLGARSGPIELRLEPIPGWQAVELSRVRREVRLRPGAASSSTSARPARRSPRTSRQRPRSRPSTGRGGVLVSLGGDIATAGDAPDGGWRILVAEDSEAPADADGETIAIPGGAIATSSTTVRRWHRGDATSTTWSTRGPGCRPTRPGGRSRSSRPRASTRTPRRRPRSCAANPASRGSTRTGLPARLVAIEGGSSGSTAGRTRSSSGEHADPVVRDPRRRHRLPDPVQRGRLPRAPRGRSRGSRPPGRAS